MMPGTCLKLLSSPGWSLGEPYYIYIGWGPHNNNTTTYYYYLLRVADRTTLSIDTATLTIDGQTMCIILHVGTTE